MVFAEPMLCSVPSYILDRVYASYERLRITPFARDHWKAQVSPLRPYVGVSVPLCTGRVAT